MMMRTFLQEHDLVGCEVSFCKGCHEQFSEQILANYKMMERFDEGARFLEEFGWGEEDSSPRGAGGSVRVAGCDQGVILR